MNTIIELMLATKDRRPIFYHKDTNCFDYWSFPKKEAEELDPNALIPFPDSNTFRFLSYEEIDHEDLMRYYVREFVDDKQVRKQLFGILSRHEYVDAYLDKLREVNLYDDFIDTCGDVYIQRFKEWADENGLDFRGN